MTNEQVKDRGRETLHLGYFLLERTSTDQSHVSHQLQSLICKQLIYLFQE